MHLNLRYAGPGDAGLIADISRQTFYEAFAAQNRPEDMRLFLEHPYSREALMAEVGRPGHVFLLACNGEEVAGYVKLREGDKPDALRDTPSLEIARLYCTAPYLGAGVGPLLMQRSLEIATEMGKEVIWLGVWEHNPRAIRFYRKWGFEKFDEHDFLLGTDLQRDWLMKRNI